MVTAVLGVFAGLFSTLIMDTAGAVGSRLRLTGRPSPTLIGRWVKSASTGTFVHRDIREVQAWQHERFVGSIVHYSIGAVLGLLYVAATRTISVRPENALAAIAYGLLTCVFSWFLLFPSFGFGLFGKNGPRDFRAPRTSTVTHLSFGVGLAVWFQLARLVGL